MPTVDGGILFDGGAGANRLIGPEAATTWHVSGSGSGDLGGSSFVRFAGVEGLTGGGLADVFLVANGAGISAIDGGGGKDTLSATDGAHSWRIASANAGSLGGSTAFSAIEVLDGSGSDTLVGPNSDQTWALTGDGSGRVANVDFQGMDRVVGGAAADLFRLPSAGSFAGAIDGGGGGDTIAGADLANEFAITAANAGTVAGASFTRVEALRGGAQGDRFIFGPGGSLSGLVDGAAGGDEVAAADRANAWGLAGVGSGSLNGDPFAGIETLTGGSGADVFRLGASVATFGGAIVGGSGGDKLAATDGANAWSIASANAGALNATTAYSGIEALAGGSGADTLSGPELGPDLDGRRGQCGGRGGPAVRGHGEPAGRVGEPRHVRRRPRRPPRRDAGRRVGRVGHALGAGRRQTPGTSRPRTPETWPASPGSRGSRTCGGGDGADRFVFANGSAGVSGGVDGGGGANTLDYAAVTVAVTVDFSAGVASGTGGIAQHHAGDRWAGSGGQRWSAPAAARLGT